MMEEQIRARRLPPLFDGEVNAQNFDEWRKNIVDLYAHECFGVTPPAPREVRAVVAEQNDDDWAGKAEHRKVMLSFDMENGEFFFPGSSGDPQGRSTLPLRGLSVLYALCHGGLSAHRGDRGSGLCAGGVLL